MGIGSALGGAFGLDLVSSATQAYFNKQSQERSQAFTREQMLNKHQWEVADLRAAGLNPILSATGGFSSGGAGGSPAPSVGKGDIASSASHLKLMNAQKNKLDQETDTIKKQGDLHVEQKSLMNAQESQAYSSRSKNVSDYKYRDEETKHLKLGIHKLRNAANVELSALGPIMAYINKAGISPTHILTAAGLLVGPILLKKVLGRFFLKIKNPYRTPKDRMLFNKIQKQMRSEGLQ